VCVNISSIKRIFSNQTHYFPDTPCNGLNGAGYDPVASNYGHQWYILQDFRPLLGVVEVIVLLGCYMA